MRHKRKRESKRDKATNHWSHDGNLELINKQPWITARVGLQDDCKQYKSGDEQTSASLHVSQEFDCRYDDCRGQNSYRLSAAH